VYTPIIWGHTIYRFTVPEKRVVITFLEQRRRQSQTAGENCTMESFTICTIHQTVIRVVIQEMGWTKNAARMWRSHMHTQCWSENLREENHLRNLAVFERIN
jgi:hypothetical protein